LSRNRVIATAAVMVAAVVVLLIAWRAIPGERPVSVLLITLDTTRADRLGCYGYTAAMTPHLDAISAAGVRFERAFCSVPLTLPSHTTILTGLQPPEHGLRINGTKRLDAEITTLADRFRQDDYRTAAFVAAFALDSKFGLDDGFEVYDDDLSGAYEQAIEEPYSLYRPGNLVADAALNWLDSHADEPFLCWVHFYDPHMPYYPHDELAGTRFRGQRSYDAEVAFMDMQVGRLMSFLRQRDLLKRTLIIVVGDHGEGLGEHGETDHGYMLYDSTLHVPLIFAWQDRLPKGARAEAMVSLSDLLPTVLDLLNMPQPKTQAERSFKSALLGQPIESRPMYAETDLPYANFTWSSLRSLLTDQWKYIRTPRAELYDRQADPRELNNLADARPEVVDKLEVALAALEGHMQRHVAADVDLTGREIDNLQALGYAAGGQDFDPNAVDISTLPDIKDRMAVVEMDRRARVLQQQGQMDRAAELYREMVLIAPESPQVRRYLGDAMTKADRLQEAAEAYRQVIDMNPDDESAHLNLGVVLARLGRPEDAIKCYDLVLRLNPDNAEAHSDLGAVLIATGRIGEAVEHLSAALKLQPEYPDAEFNMARACTLRGDFEQAAGHYRQALRLEPNRLNALNALAWLLATREGVNASHPDEAIELAERACELTGYREPAIVDTLAAAYASVGRFPDAITAAQKALDAATARNQTELADSIADRLKLYQAGQPYRAP
jgi:arylsulfatase A-like enzyme/Tfp pilus assembly protein PilF